MSDALAMTERSALTRLLRPRHLAVVGASPEPASAGGIVLANLERFGYAGDLHLVSRSRSEINGRPCVPTIDDLPEGIDAVVLVVPAVAVRDAAAECGVKLWLHGHRHKWYVLPRAGNLPFATVCTGSTTQARRWGYHDYALDGFHLIGLRRVYDEATGTFLDADRFELEL